MKRIVSCLITLPLFAAAQQVTFNKHVAPLVFHYCAPCHRAGEAAPFPLLTYEDVQKHAAQMVAVTGRRYMPPWPPEPGYGDFAGERRLSDDQLHLIAEWVRQGKLRGEPADLPPPPQFTEGWQLGPPDLVVELPKAYQLAASGSDVFRNFVVPLDLKQTRYVRAIELRPGNKRIVHHANLVFDHRQTLRRLDGQDGQPGFPGMDVPTEARSDSFDPDSHFFFWKPGSVLEPAPEGMSRPLDPGTDLILNLHLQPSGKPETLRPVVGFYFTAQPPREFPMLLQLEHDGALDIPAGVHDFAITDRLTLPVGVDLLAIYPHAHYIGKRVECWAVLPDGSRRELIRINDWDLNWQAVYTYREPVRLPKGATVEMRITYDNSAANPRNSSNPPKRVRGGPRSEDEMGHVWLQVLPQKESSTDPRAVLQEALMRRRLEKYPVDFVAQCNLGGLLAMRGEHREALAHFEEALHTNPASATARNGLGASLLASGRVDDAIREFRESLRLDPLHINARWNLARALIGKQDRAGAAVELETLLEQKPDHADAQVGLGLLYFMERRLDDALPHLQIAARLRPGDAGIRTNLGALLASRGDLRGAIQAFEEALKLNPEDATARTYLMQARAGLAKTQ